MQGSFLTVFDFIDEGYPIAPTIFGTLAVLASVGIHFELKKMMPHRSPEPRMKISGFFLSATILWTVVTTHMIFTEFVLITRAIENGEAKVAVGLVERYIPFLNPLSAWEEFCVQKACFHYSNLVPSAGFNNSALYGGPIRPHLFVRVIYTGNTILKLEMAQ